MTDAQASRARHRRFDRLSPHQHLHRIWALRVGDLVGGRADRAAAHRSSARLWAIRNTGAQWRKHLQLVHGDEGRAKVSCTTSSPSITIRALAEGTQVSLRTLYHLFGSREALIGSSDAGRSRRFASISLQLRSRCGPAALPPRRHAECAGGLSGEGALPCFAQPPFTQ